MVQDSAQGRKVLLLLLTEQLEVNFQIQNQTKVTIPNISSLTRLTVTKIESTSRHASHNRHFEEK